MIPLPITARTLTSALGSGVDPHLQAFISNRGGLLPCDFDGVDFPTWIGRVEAVEESPVRPDLAAWDCRNNRLAQLGLSQDGFVEAVNAAVSRYGKDRLGIFLGTSTSGILETELAYAARDAETDELPPGFKYATTQNLYSMTDFCRRYLDLAGPAMTISTACSSSAKVFAAAWRYISSGYCDAAVVGGVDSLCLTTLYGFHSLGLLNPEHCAPWDLQRAGINIGEAAGFALLEREPIIDSGIALMGYGETSDAYHMSTPHPGGVAAAQAMQDALQGAGLQPTELDYINLHGTGTSLNDLSEDKAMLLALDSSTPRSSTKGWTGHTLGAAGIVEAVLSLLSIEYGILPASYNFNHPDPDLTTSVLRETKRHPVTYAMTNSFGFGGSNCTLIFGRTG